MLAFVGRTEGKAQLWVRSLGESESRLLPGTEGAYNPFWSPDSRWIAFFTPQKLKKIEVASGAIVELSDVSHSQLGELELPRRHLIGELAFVSTLNRSTHPAEYRMPADRRCRCRERKARSSPTSFPMAGDYLYTEEMGNRDLWLASLDPDEKPRRIGEAGRRPTYSAGHMLSVVNGILMARPFDPARGEFTGESFPLKHPWQVASIWELCSPIFPQIPRACWYIRRRPIR